MTRRILIPLDGTPSAEGALDFVEQWTGRQDMEVLLVGVWQVDENSLGGDPIRRRLASQVLECASRNLRTYLSRAEERLRGRGVSARCLVLPGQAGRDLAALARSEGIDLILAGPNGLAGARCQHPLPDWCAGPCPLPA